MAYEPPPESIVTGSFAGIKNTVSEERLSPNELAAAVNVDIDDVGQLRRRRGRMLVDAARYHSLSEVGGRVLVVRNGLLGQLDASYQHTTIIGVGDGPLCYTAVGNDIYFSGGASGKIIGGRALPWGIADGKRWLSPVLQPTETLGEISGRLVGSPPTARILEHYKGRIYLAVENVLWGTELYLYDVVDTTKNFVVLDHAITMVAAVDDGLYVGTDQQLLFLQGTMAKGLERAIVMDAPVVFGSKVTVPYSKAHPQARSGPIPEGFGPMFMTTQGVCLGLPGGQVYNLTQDHVVFPEAVRAAALYREDQGANSYVAVADSAGGPSANARIGDYVDAEIVRASQGG